MAVYDYAEGHRTVVEKHKVVITLKDGSVIKGFLGAEEHVDLNSLISNSRTGFRDVLGARFVADDGTQPEIDWEHAKAVFFVSSFEGDSKRETVRFYSNGPEVGSIWVEIVFRDGEILEGCIHNSIHHLVDDGFFFHPSDPGSNNIVIYVNKSAIVNYRVLGIRTLENG